MNEIATNDFDYSLLDVKTKEFLEESANIIYGIQSKSAYEIGKQLAKAQEKLAQNRYGCFEEWYRSLGFKKTKESPLYDLFNTDIFEVEIIGNIYENPELAEVE